MIKGKDCVLIDIGLYDKSEGESIPSVIKVSGASSIILGGGESK